MLDFRFLTCVLHLLSLPSFTFCVTIHKMPRKTFKLSVIFILGFYYLDSRLNFIRYNERLMSSCRFTKLYFVSFSITLWSQRVRRMSWPFSQWSSSCWKGDLETEHHLLFPGGRHNVPPLSWPWMCERPSGQSTPLNSPAPRSRDMQATFPWKHLWLKGEHWGWD